MARQAKAQRRRLIVDPRLLRYARATRTSIVALTATGSAAAVLVVAQAWLLADLLAAAFTGSAVAALRAPLSVLAAVVALRAGLIWASELIAVRCSIRAKQQLRAALLSALISPGRAGPTRQSAGTGGVSVLATDGIDALDSYFSEYLPRLLLAVIVPLAVLAAVLWADWISAAIIAVTLPLIPVFMALVGACTRDRTNAQLRALQRLAAHFLDVMTGLTTLKVFGAARRQIGVLAHVGERQRTAAMATLRLTFLSSLVLELLATLSVALVAVAVGLRLLYGQMDLRTALFVLVLAPEAYLPLRALGAAYHAGADGTAAAEQAFELLETPDDGIRGVGERRDRAPAPDPSLTGVTVQAVRLHHPGRTRPALDGVSLRVGPGETIAVTGPSGCGKSSLISVLLGRATPSSGTVWIGDRELTSVPLAAWRAQLAWLPQRPHLFNASIAENIAIGDPAAGAAQIRRAALAAGLGELIAARPEGLAAPVGERGAGLSAGERQRVALARVLVRDAPLLLLDEPTANLDGATEEQVLASLRDHLRNRTVILVAHRPSLAALADRVVELPRAVEPRRVTVPA